MDFFGDPSGKAGGGWGVQPSSTTGATDTKEQTGEETLKDVLRSADMFDAFDNVGPGGVGDFGLMDLEQPAGISRAPKHGIVCLDAREMGVQFCGGQMGANGGKMCVRTDCMVKSHLTKATSLFAENQMVFIQGQASKGALTAVFSVPAIPRSAFDNEAWNTTWNSALKSLRTWQVSFDSLASAEIRLDVEASVAVCDRTTESKITFAATPRKQPRSTSIAAESPGMTVVLESPLIPMIDDLGPTDTLMMTALGPAWQTLAENMKAVERIARAAHVRAKEGEAAMQGELDQVDLKLAALNSLLGERSAKFGTQTAFEAVTAVLDQLDELAEGLGKEVLEALDAAREKIAADLSARLSQIVTDQITAQVFSGRFFDEIVAPVSLLLKRCSPSADRAGDLWEGRLAALEREMVSAREATRPAAMEVEEPVNAWTGGRWNGNLPPAPRPVEQAADASASEEIRLLKTSLATLQRQVNQRSVGAGLAMGADSIPSPANEARLAALEQMVKELKNQAQRSGVSIRGFSFDSSEDVRAWMTKHGVEHLVHLFVDPLSLMALSDSYSVTEDAASAARVMSAKMGETPEITKYRASFLVEIPTILGKNRVSSSSIATDKQLAAIPKHTDWNTGTGSDGVADRMARLLDMGETTCGYEIDGKLAGPPHALATKLLTSARNYREKVSSWMTLYHSEVGNRSHATKEECWLLVTSCVRTILSEAHIARLPGRNSSPHDMLWGTLQAHAFFMSLTSGKIQGHPKVSVILQGHVVDHSTPIALYRALEAKVTELSKAVGAAKGNADRAAAARAKNQANN